MHNNNLLTELKSGFTTGTCASAAAKAAAYMLINKVIINHVSVVLPARQNVVFELVNASLSTTEAFCGIIKDAGDDPDITHGAEICAKAVFTNEPGVTIKAGKGIGMVTKPGLAVAMGQPAINPTPRTMIIENVSEILPPNTGIEITITIPNGEELAKKTFNPRLGIVGGLSILGTTGIVKPMSEEALKDSLVIKLNQLAHLGCSYAVFSPGNYATAFAKANFNYNEQNTVLTSNYIGFMLEQAVKHRFKTIVLVGHIGKLAKLAGGIFNTHSRTADARNEILAAHYFNLTGDNVGFNFIMKANTTEEIADNIKNKAFWNHIAGLIKSKAESYVYNDLTIEVIVFSQNIGMLACTTNALSLLNCIYESK